MLLQAYDFAHLHQNFGCSLQVGGSDQWGNITAGIDFHARRMHSVQLFGMTCTLLTSDGRKMGKTERGAIWLDAARTCLSVAVGCWINVNDADVLMCLEIFGVVDVEEYQSLEQSVATEPHKRNARRRLASWLTEFVHGSIGLQAAERATAIFFGAEFEKTTDSRLQEILAMYRVPSSARPTGNWTVDSGCTGLGWSCQEQGRSTPGIVRGEHT